MRAVAVGLPFAPAVVDGRDVRCFADLAHAVLGTGSRAAGAVLGLGVSHVVLAGAGVRAVAVGLPLAPAVVDGGSVSSLADLAHTVLGAAGLAAGAVLGLGVVSVVGAHAGMRAVVVGLPLAPVVIVRSKLAVAFAAALADGLLGTVCLAAGMFSILVGTTRTAVRAVAEVPIVIDEDPISHVAVLAILVGVKQAAVRTDRCAGAVAAVVVGVFILVAVLTVAEVLRTAVREPVGHIAVLTVCIVILRAAVLTGGAAGAVAAVVGALFAVSVAVLALAAVQLIVLHAPRRQRIVRAVFVVILLPAYLAGGPAGAIAAAMGFVLIAVGRTAVRAFAVMLLRRIGLPVGHVDMMIEVELAMGPVAGFAPGQ